MNGAGRAWAYGLLGLLAAAVVVALIATLGGDDEPEVELTPVEREPDGARTVWGEPEGGNPTAVVMLLHGGGWQPDIGQFELQKENAKALNVEGYATVAVGYDTGAKGFRQVEAVYDEARERYPGLPVCATGLSAGGHLALMLATKEPDLACVIDVSGPTDLTTLDDDDEERDEAYGAAVAAFGEQNLERFSPARFADRIQAPVLMVMAETDPVNPVEQGERLTRVLPGAELLVLPEGPVPAEFAHMGGVQPDAAQIAIDRQLEFLRATTQGELIRMGVVPSRLADKPQYVFHPGRALRRAMHRFTAKEGRTEVAQLPWGLPLEVSMSDSIGFSIVVGRVFDPCVTEAVHRLIDPGDAVADVGANVGYVTSLAAARTGAEGRVLAFEPHPRVFELLERNAARWREAAAVEHVELNRVALADAEGEGTLVSGPTFDANMGLSSLASAESDATGVDLISVPLARLDAIAPAGGIGLLKIDVEGHEADVLRGAAGALASGAVRDVIFEDHDPYPSEATELVEKAGYELIALENDLWGLRLVAPADRGEVSEWPGPSYLATRDPERARRLLGQRGWQVSGIGPSLRSRRAARH